MGSLPLALWDTLEAAAVNFGEIGRIIDDKRENHRIKTIRHADLDVENIIRTKINYQQLQHQRGAAHHRDIEPDKNRQRTDPAGSSHTHQKAQRQRKQQGEKEDPHGFHHAASQLRQCNTGHTIR